MPSNAVARQRATRRSWLPAVALFTIAWLAASASHAGEWTEGASRDQSFSRVLVVGISPDLNTRCPFERALATRLKSANTAALVSCDVMPRGAELTREAVEATVAATNADAVLVTSLISKEWGTKEGGSNDTRGGTQYKAVDSYYGVYGTVVAADFHAMGPITTVQGAAHVTTKLYETRGATVIYTLDTKVKKVESRQEGFAVISEPIVKQLRKDGLVR